MIETHDPAAEPFKDSARALVRAVAADDAAACDAAFAGTGDDRLLLDATRATNTAGRALTDARVARFGPTAAPHRERHGFTDGQPRSTAVSTAVVDDATPDRASLSPGGFPFDGYERVRREGRWVVRSITVFSDDVAAMRATPGPTSRRYQAATAKRPGSAPDAMPDVRRL